MPEKTTEYSTLQLLLSGVVQPAASEVHHLLCKVSPATFLTSENTKKISDLRTV